MSLNSRRRIEVEMPEFLFRSLQRRVANANSTEGVDPVDLNDVIEWYLAAPITVADVPHFEASIPGFTDALSAWLSTVTYDPR